MLFQDIIQVFISLGNITFYIIPAYIHFLFFIQDIDTISIKLDNLKNILIQEDKIVPVIRK
jgi:hypothetical protein